MNKKTIFSNAGDAKTRARENVHRIAAVVNRDYFPLPRFRVQCFNDFLGYWRAYHRHMQTPGFVIYSMDRYLSANDEARAKEEAKIAKAFVNNTTLCFAPVIWEVVAEFPATGLVEEQHWIMAAICAHEIFHLHGDPDVRSAADYVIEQSLAELGALDLVVKTPLFDAAYFDEHPDELTDRYLDVLNYTTGPDILTQAKGFPRLLATVLLHAAGYDREAAYKRLLTTYRQPETFPAIVESFRQAALGLAPEAGQGGWDERVFADTNGSHHLEEEIAATALLVPLVNLYYDQEIHTHLDNDALLSLLNFEERFHLKEEMITPEDLLAQLEALRAKKTLPASTSANPTS